ncbi:MAG: beta-lactamase family protein [Saprospiraceae bacterium]|nr:beta-lactamase family protein [Saprospiraceae bacterium]
MSKSPGLTEGTPESVGMSGERIARIEKMCEDAVKDHEIPGIVALVARKGKIVYYKAFGQSKPNGEALEKDDIFRIASQSKAITSTAVMMLWEEGRFQLDDPISKYIPEFKEPQVLSGFRYSDTTYTTVPADKEITIRHLLTHTSGLGYGIIDGDERFKMIYGKAGVTDLFTTKPITIKESVLKLAKLPLHHNPGEKFTYSEGLDVLGYFIEVISGMSFSDFLQKRLFQPLGMHDTYFYLPENKSDRLVAVQQWQEGQWQQYPVTFYDTDYPKKGAMTFYSGGAGLSSTAKDYATFLQMYLNGGAMNGVRILSRTTIQAILSGQVGDLLGDDRSYGLAFGLTTPDGAAKGGNGSEGTFDWGGYFNTQYFADPDEELIGVIMKQTQGPVGDQTRWKFRILTAQAIDD